MDQSPITRDRHTMVMASLRQIGAAIADVLIPPVCLACHEPLATHDTICADCWSDITFIHAPVCDRLGIPLPFDPRDATHLAENAPVVSAAALATPPDYDRARAAAQFSGILRTMIHALKYGDRHTARHLFARWLHQAARDLLDDTHVLIPVPLHARRLRARRFNQSALLAQDLAERTGKPYDPMILTRSRNTRAQVGLTRSQRLQNLQGAFSVAADAAAALQNRNVLLVDDVITSGTTINACARVLKRAGAARVDVVAVAMVTDAARINP